MQRQSTVVISWILHCSLILLAAVISNSAQLLITVDIVFMSYNFAEIYLRKFRL